MIWVSVIVIFVISFVLALASVEKELSVPEEVKSIRITKQKKLSGVILFFKEKISHYTSQEKSEWDNR